MVLNLFFDVISCFRQREAHDDNSCPSISSARMWERAGATWLRINFATPRPILEAALSRLEDAFQDLRMRKPFPADSSPTDMIA